MSDERDKKEIIARKNAAIIAAGDYATVRSTAYEVTDPDWIKGVLRRGAFGTLATVSGHQPFLNTQNYVYDETANAIYLHRARVGRTSANLAENPHVCYSVSEMGSLYTGASFNDFGVEYRSVVVFGKAVLVEDQAEARHALQILLDKYAPHLKAGIDYVTFTPQEAEAPAVYKIIIERWSGKKNDLPDDERPTHDFPPDEA